MTYEADRRDLARHEDEIARYISFNYAVFNHDETELLGCVYIDPPEKRTPPGADALVSWWWSTRKPAASSSGRLTRSSRGG